VSLPRDGRRRGTSKPSAAVTSAARGGGSLTVEARTCPADLHNGVFRRPRDSPGAASLPRPGPSALPHRWRDPALRHHCGRRRGAGLPHAQARRDRLDPQGRRSRRDPPRLVHLGLHQRDEAGDEAGWQAECGLGQGQAPGWQAGRRAPLDGRSGVLVVLPHRGEEGRRVRGDGPAEAGRGRRGRGEQVLPPGGLHARRRRGR